MSGSLLAPTSTHAARTLAVRSPAKLNLTLDVLGRRSDGYHDLRSVVIGVDLCDHIRCTSNPTPAFEVECTDASLRGPMNIADRAGRALAQHCGVEPEAHLALCKRIPVGGGLGGGSGNAAATLRLCNELWGTGLSDTELTSVAATIGSDVPLFFSLPSAVIQGRGERVRRIRLRWSGWALLVSPGFAISTADVYHAWRRDDAREAVEGKVEALADAAFAVEITPWLGNQLESAVFRVRPPLRELRDALDQVGVGPMRVTGSGSTLYRLFDDQPAARRAAQRIRDRIGRVRCYVAAAPVGLSSIFSEES